VLPKENRLKKKKDLERVLKEGQTLKEGFLLLKILENDIAKRRFAFVVSKKISKKAVLRNKVKRRLREIVRQRLKEIKKGIDGVFIALPGIEKENFSQIEKMVKKLFKKANILTTNNVE